MSWLHVERANTPLILAFPHGGTEISEEYLPEFRSRDLALLDTDWHIRRLYDGLVDATFVWTDISRSVIDCNRDPSGASLYPGQATTGLCPTETFDGEPLYNDGAAPEVEARRTAYHQPYHAALANEIERLRARHPRVVLYDCHSIRGVVPRLFDGELPELNVGTDNGATCDIALSDAVMAECGPRWSVLNGRFRGGWTTRHYGQPEGGVHAIQMETAMRAYLDESPLADGQAPAWDDGRAAGLRTDLARILAAVLDFAKGRP